MIDVVPFKAEHLAVMRLQDAQAHLSEWITKEQGEALEALDSYTAMHNGVPVGAAGIIPQWEGRSLAWSFLTQTGPKHFLAVHRAVKRALDACDVRRLEMTVDCDFPQAHRWARMLGFYMECERMTHYSPDGRDSSLYVRIR